MTKRRLGRRVLRRVTVAAVIVGTAAAATPFADAEPAASRLADRLVRSVTVDKVHRHLIALQRIADTNGGNRPPTPGYRREPRLHRRASCVARASGQHADVHLQPGRCRRRGRLGRVGHGRTHADDRLPEHPGRRGHRPAARRSGRRHPGCQPEDYAGHERTGTIALISAAGARSPRSSSSPPTPGAIAVLIYNHVDGPRTRRPRSDARRASRPPASPGRGPRAGRRRRHPDHRGRSLPLGADHQPQPDDPDQDRPHRQRRDGRCAPGQRPDQRRDQRQRHGLGGAAGDRAAARQLAAGEQRGPVRLVGR